MTLVLGLVAAPGSLGAHQFIIIKLGTAHMVEGPTGAVGRFLPEFEGFAAPYIWQETDHMLKVVRALDGRRASRVDWITGDRRRGRALARRLSGGGSGGGDRRGPRARRATTGR